MNPARIAAAAAAISLCSAPATADGPAVAPSPNGAFLGAYVNPSGRHQQPRAAFSTAIHELEAQMRSASGVDRRLALHLHFYGWRTIVDVPNDPSIADDFANGRTPVITWTCGDSLSAIASGRDDGDVIAAARALGSLPKPVMLRFFHEFNLNLTGGTANGQSRACFDPGDPSKPATFIAAWRHIHDTFARERVANVSWIWNPDAGIRSIEKTDLMAYFPGAAYVDWIGGDFYDRRSAGFAQTAAPFYAMAHASQPQIPLIVVETGAQAASGLQPRYFDDIAAELPARFPQIRGLIYFDAPGLTPNKWALTPPAVASFAQLAAKPYFRATPP